MVWYLRIILWITQELSQNQTNLRIMFFYKKPGLRSSSKSFVISDHILVLKFLKKFLNLTNYIAIKT